MYRGGSTKSRIFGNDYNEAEEQNAQKRKQALKHGKDENKAEPQAQKDEKSVGQAVLAEVHPDSIDNVKEEVGKDSIEEQKPVTDPRMKAMETRQRSFMDEDLTNNNRVRDQQMQQKKWLDQQIAERKLRIEKEKQSDKDISNTQSGRNISYASNTNLLSEQKRDTSQQIQDYNVAAAKQKREKEKYEKQQDQLEANNNYGKPSTEDVKKLKDRNERLDVEKEEMAQKERALSRDIHDHISKIN